MRTQFVECTYRYQAYRACPWATKVGKACNGFMCFESHDDYITWKRQK